MNTTSPDSERLAGIRRVSPKTGVRPGCPPPLARLASLAGISLALFLSGCAAAGSEVTVLRGEAHGVNLEGDAIGFTGRRVAGSALERSVTDEGFVVAGASWRDAKGWYDSSAPACLSPGASRQPVEMGVLEASPTADAPGRPVVVWLKCLGGPSDGDS